MISKLLYKKYCELKGIKAVLYLVLSLILSIVFLNCFGMGNLIKSFNRYHLPENKPILEANGWPAGTWENEEVSLKLKRDGTATAFNKKLGLENTHLIWATEGGAINVEFWVTTPSEGLATYALEDSPGLLKFTSKKEACEVLASNQEHETVEFNYTSNNINKIQTENINNKLVEFRRNTTSAYYKIRMRGFDNPFLFTAPSVPGDLQYAEIKNKEKEFYRYDNISHYQTLKGHSKRVNSIVISPDCNCIVSGGNDYSLKVWNQSESLFSLGHTIEKEHSSGVGDVVFSKDGQYLASVGSEAKLWKKSEEGLTFLQDLGHGYSADFSPNGQYIAVGGEYRGKIALWKRNGIEFSRIKTLKTKDENIFIVFSPDGNYLAVGSHHLSIWKKNAGSFKLLDYLHDGTKRSSYSEEYNTNIYVKNLTFSPNGNFLAVGNNRGEILIWRCSKDLFTHYKTIKTKNNRYKVQSIAFSPSNRYLASSVHRDTLINIYSNFSFSHSIKTNFNTNSLAFSLDGKYLIAGSNNYSVNVFLCGKLAEIYQNNRNEMESEVEKIKNLLAPKNEFETENEFKDRLAKGEKEKENIKSKYDLIFRGKKEAFHQEFVLFKKRKEEYIQSKIRESQKEVTLTIDSVG